MVEITTTISLLATNEGALALIFCLTVYLVSVRSLGRRSVAQAWLFSGLSVLTPTDQSVARIVGASSLSLSQKSTSTSRKSAASRPLATPQERLAALELSQTQLQPGSITMHALKAQETTELYKALDLSVSFGISNLFLLSIRWAWKQYSMRELCAAVWDGGGAHDGEMSKEASSSIDLQYESSRPSLLVSLFVLLAARAWWRHTCHASKSPSGLMSHLPSTYVVGFLWSLSSWFLLSHYIALRIPVCQQALLALEELTIRCWFWIRLLGYKVDAPMFLPVAKFLVGLASSMVAGAVGFGLAEPFQTIHESMAEYHQGGRRNSLLHQVESSGSSQTDKSQSSLRMESMGAVRGAGAVKTIAWVGTMLIPMFLLVSYISPSNIFFSSYRITVTWLLLLFLGVLTKEFQQNYLLSSVNKVVTTLQSPTFTSGGNNEDDLSSIIINPFSIRNKNLLRHASLLSSLPLLLVVLLTIVLLNPFDADLGIYPAVYKEGGLTSAGDQRLQEWSQRKKNLLTERLCYNGTLKLSTLFTTSSLSTVSQQQPKNELEIERKLVDSDKSAFSVSDLIATEAPALTLLGSLRRFQREIKATRQRHAAHMHRKKGDGRPDHSTTAGRTTSGLRDAQDNLVVVLRAVVSHPFAPPSVLFPLVDFLIFIISAFAAMEITIGVFQYSQVSRERRQRIAKVTVSPPSASA